MAARLIDLIWPAVCILCRGRSGRDLDACPQCEADLPLNDPACARCAAPLHAVSEDDRLCARCLRRPPHFHAAYAAFRYAYPVDRLIQRLKYRRDAPSGRLLGVLLAQRLQLQRPDPLPALIIPTPLSTRRYRERGFNQAYELALPLRSALGTPLRADLVCRRRDTAEQSGLGRTARRKNLRGAFVLNKPLPAAHIAIVDDVVTTTSTANELAKVLLRAGAERVEVWAAARTEASDW